MSEIKRLQEKIRGFIEERDWYQFHHNKDLAISLSLEASEVLEIFQWKTNEQAEAWIAENKEELADELADVAIYLLELADNNDVDIIQAMEAKIAKNAKKYPVEKAKGVATKYTKL